MMIYRMMRCGRREEDPDDEMNLQTATHLSRLESQTRVCLLRTLTSSLTKYSYCTRYIYVPHGAWALVQCSIFRFITRRFRRSRHQVAPDRSSASCAYVWTVPACRSFVDGRFQSWRFDALTPPRNVQSKTHPLVPNHGHSPSARSAPGRCTRAAERRASPPPFPPPSEPGRDIRRSRRAAARIIQYNGWTAV